jgi:hypothetical protein
MRQIPCSVLTSIISGLVVTLRDVVTLILNKQLCGLHSEISMW